MAFDLAGQAVKGGIELLPKLGNLFKGIPGFGTVAKAAGAFVIADVAAAGVERATGVDIPILGGTLSQEAVAGAAQSVGSIVGGAQGAATRGVAQGGIQGLFPGLSSAQASQYVTLAILGIGGVLLFKAIAD